MKISTNIFLQYAVLIIAIYFVVFMKLDAFPIRLWDESMFAVNAYEMLENGNYMVPYFDGDIDLRQTKPLLTVWIQAVFIKLIGFNALAIRLPSAIAVTLSIVFLFRFLTKNIGSLFAWLSSLVLMTSIGFITYHTGRTGDADALLSLFVLLSFINLYSWLINEKSNNIIYTALFFGLAFLTKSFAALIFGLPFIIVALIYKREFFTSQLKTFKFYIGVLLFLTLLFVGTGLREIYESGFLARTFSSDAGRIFYSAGGHAKSWDFYLETIFYSRFSFWATLSFLGVIFAFIIPKYDEQLRIAIHSAAIISILYLVVISFSTTKLIWYDMPIYPFLSILAAYPLYLLFEKLELNFSPILSTISCVAIFFIPYRQLFFQAQGNPIKDSDKKIEALSFYLHDMVKNNNINSLTVWHQGYKGSLLCYHYMFKAHNKNITIKYKPDFKTGEHVLVANDKLKTQLIKQYAFDSIEQKNNALLTQIK